ncbi:MAG TPA: GNAT family N-acetyltransferase [Steroidobacteraceae bacterium]|nr:GNAT family N-acetyltransferase [Steroidobacteraceae bacterium]
MAKIFLETARLRLREFSMDDVDHIVALDSDPEVMRYISFGAPTPRETIVTRVLPSWLKYYGNNERNGFWAAELKSTGEFIGWFHLRPDRFDAGEQELGYRVRRDMWRHGFATEGSRALLQDGFIISQFPKITARTLLANVGSQRVMQKCGLQFETEFIYPEHMLRGGTEEMRRAVKYSALRNQWLTNMQSPAL